MVLADQGEQEFGQVVDQFSGFLLQFCPSEVAVVDAHPPRQQFQQQSQQLVGLVHHLLVVEQNPVPDNFALYLG